MVTKLDNEAKIDEAYQDLDRSARAKALSNAEESGAHDSIPGYNRGGDGLDERENEFEDPAKAVRDQESSSGGNWLNNVTAAGNNKKLAGSLMKAGAKKAIAPAAVIFLGLSLFAIVMLLAGGSNLLNTVAQKAVEQTMNATPAIIMLRSMQLQEQRLNDVKDSTVSGFCSNVMSIRCRFSTFSDSDIKAMEREGVKVKTKTGGIWDKIRGRKAVESVEIDGKTYSAKELASAIKNRDGTVVARISAATAPRWKTFSSNAFYKVLNKFGGTKVANIKTAQDRATFEKELIDRVSGKQGAIERLGLVPETDSKDNITGYTDPATGESYKIGDPKLDALLKNDASYAKIQELRDTVKETGDKVSKFAAKNSVKAFAVGVGVVQIGCAAWNTVRTVEAVTTQVGLQNMMSYSMVFLNQASMIKAGDGQAAVAGYLGDTLMSPNSAGMSGPDSRAGKQLFFGEQSPLPTTTFADPNNPTAAEQQQAELNSEVTNYTAGATMGPDALKQLVSHAGVNPNSPGWVQQADEICGFMNSRLIGGLMLGAGLAVTAACFASAVVPVLGAATVTGCVADVAYQAGTALIIGGVLAGLMSMLNVISGTMITGQENGPESMAAFVTGTEGIGYNTGINSGLTLGTAADAASFQANVVAPANLAYANIDRAHYAWYDTSNSNTMLGSIAASFYPTFASITNSNNFPQLMGTFGSILASPMKLLEPQADAQTASSACGSTIYEGYAVSQNCVPLAVTSTKILQTAGLASVDYLINNGEVDEQGKLIGPHIMEFIKNCTTERVAAFGSVEEGQDFNDVNTGAICSTEYDGPNAETYQNVQVYMQYASATSDVDVLEEYQATLSGTATSTETSATTTSPTLVDTPSKDGWSVPIQNGGVISLDWHVMASKGLHKGMDFPAVWGTPVTAAHDGKVTLVKNMGSCGWATVIEATGVSGIYHAYQHMDPSVKVGDIVKRGQWIGNVGTFCGTGNHLHFSIETANRVSAYADSGSSDTSRDPKDYLPL